MLDLKFVTENQQLLEQMLQNRRSDLELQPLLTLDQERRQIIQEVESLKHERK
ncbi:MAG: serine--tRNA ligase, partial [Desulfobacteraceae bacterium]